MKIKLTVLFLASVLLASCSQTEVPMKKSFQAYEVSTGTVTESDRIIAMVEGKTSADLAFKTSGRIATILVKQGDHVKQGQILATLGNEEASITTNGLSNVLGNLSGMLGSIGTLYDARIENLDNDAEKAKIGVELAQKDLDLARQTLKNSVDIFSGSLLSSSEKVVQAEKNLNYANNNLVNSTKLLDIQGESLRKNALNSLSNAFIIARNSRDFVDETLGVTDANKSKNDAFESYLGAKDTSKKTATESAFHTFNTEYEAMYVWYYANIVGKNTVSKETLGEGLTRSLTIMEHLRDMLHALSGVLEASITSSNFPDTELSALKVKTSLFLSNLELTILDSNGNGIKGSIAAIDAFDSSYALKIQQLHDALSLAEADLSLAKTGKDTSSGDVHKNLDILTASVKMKEDALNLAKIAISEVDKNKTVLQSERNSKLREIDSNFSQTQMNKNLAVNSIESGIIRSSFDGAVLKKNLDAGSVVSAGMPVFSVSSTDGKVVKTYFDSETHPLTIGDTITFSTMGSDHLYKAKVTLINPSPDVVHNKSYFEAILSDFPGVVGNRIEILLSKKSESSGSSVIIPLSTIIAKYGVPGVYALDGNRAKFTLVTILRSDGKYASVTGLSIGQKVVTEGKENILDGEILE